MWQMFACVTVPNFRRRCSMSPALLSLHVPFQQNTCLYLMKCYSELLCCLLFQHPFNFNFCHAFQCICVAFAIMLCMSICLSMRLSVTSMYSVKTNKHYFLPSCSHTILVFPYQTLWQSSDRDPRIWGKNVIFDQYLALASMTGWV